MGFERSLTHLGMSVECDASCLLEPVPERFIAELLILDCLADELIWVTLNLREAGCKLEHSSLESYLPDHDGSTAVCRKFAASAPIPQSYQAGQEYRIGQ